MSDQTKRVEGGYIILARKIIDSEIWEKPVGWKAIWIHILLKVNWKDTSRMKMAEGYFSWPIESPFLKGVTERQWGNVLVWLKNKGMIKKQKKKLGCIISVCNYEPYQDPEAYKKGTKKEKKKEQERNKKGTLIREEGKKERSNTHILKDEREEAEKIIQLYYDLCPDYPKLKKLNPNRIKQIQKFIKTFSLDEIREIFQIVQSSEFLKNGSGTWPGATFDWIININNATKILEGNYEGGRSAKPETYNYHQVSKGK